MNLKKQRGMTLLEVIIVLGIMGVISAGVVILAQRAIDNQNVSKLSQALNTIQTAMVQTYRSKQSYPDVLQDAVKAKKLTDALVSMGRVTESDLINPFAGAPMLIFTAKDNKAANRGFAIKVSDLSKDQCTSLISNSADLFSFIEVQNRGTAMAADFYVDPDATKSVGVIKSTKGGAKTLDLTNLDHISALCGGPGAGDSYFDVFVGNR